jgi:hypothetical protein
MVERCILCEVRTESVYAMHINISPAVGQWHCSWVSRVKRPGLEIDHSPASSAEVRSGLCGLMGRYLQIATSLSFRAVTSVICQWPRNWYPFFVCCRFRVQFSARRPDILSVRGFFCRRILELDLNLGVRFLPHRLKLIIYWWLYWQLCNGRHMNRKLNPHTVKGSKVEEVEV